MLLLSGSGIESAFTEFAQFWLLVSNDPDRGITSNGDLRRAGA